jgi:hypothetical protein
MLKGHSTLFIILAVILALGALVFVLRFVIGGNEDTWICVDGKWVKHGNPNVPAPQTGCTAQGVKTPTPSPTPNPTSSPQIPNPASVYCEKHGGKLKIITNPDGSQYGLCIFPDGRQCEEWDFFRTKTCK